MCSWPTTFYDAVGGHSSLRIGFKSCTWVTIRLHYCNGVRRAGSRCARGTGISSSSFAYLALVHVHGPEIQKVIVPGSNLASNEHWPRHLPLVDDCRGSNYCLDVFGTVNNAVYKIKMQSAAQYTGYTQEWWLILWLHQSVRISATKCGCPSLKSFTVQFYHRTSQKKRSPVWILKRWSFQDTGASSMAELWVGWEDFAEALAVKPFERMRIVPWFLLAVGGTAMVMSCYPHQSVSQYNFNRNCNTQLVLIVIIGTFRPRCIFGETTICVCGCVGYQVANRCQQWAKLSTPGYILPMARDMC